MAPKKTVAPEEGIASSESPNKDEKVSGKSSKAPDVARKTHLHPPTMIMVKEALKELDSRKGVSSQAIRSYITEKYPSLDQVRLKYMMRKALNKGIESGVLARPPNSTASGAQGRFRLAVRGKLKEPKVTSKPICPIGWDNCCLLSNTLQWRAGSCQGPCEELSRYLSADVPNPDNEPTYEIAWGMCSLEHVCTLGRCR
uniref:H15 domain-containing protein n=1 Tax=Oncorhynchus mykiss TaxID=8022 RepID=A0A8C7LYJ7_ONCMY